MVVKLQGCRGQEVAETRGHCRSRKIGHTRAFPLTQYLISNQNLIWIYLYTYILHMDWVANSIFLHITIVHEITKSHGSYATCFDSDFDWSWNCVWFCLKHVEKYAVDRIFVMEVWLLWNVVWLLWRPPHLSPLIYFTLIFQIGTHCV